MIRVKSALLIFLNFFGIMKSCSQNNLPVSGGRTVRQEKCDPIKSTELKSLSVSMFISPRAYRGAFEGHYSIKVQPADDGKFTLSCEGNTVTIGADEVMGFQNIIMAHGLESKNGLYSVTAGLAPEYQPMHFDAEYASGEKLSFTVNNEPLSQWEILLFRYVRDLLLAHGDKAYVVPEDMAVIGRMKFEYTDSNGREYSYDNITDEDVVKLMRTVYDHKKDDCISDEMVAIPNGYYECLSKLIDKLGLVWIANEMHYLQKPDLSKHSYLRIYVADAENNPIFSSTYHETELNDNMLSIIRQLREYMDKPFEKKTK